MSSRWQEVELGEFIELKRGYDLPKKNRLDGKIPVVSSSGESGFHSVSKVKGPGVITGRYGTIGQVFYVEEDYWPLNTTLYVKDFKGNDPLFVYYLLKTVRFFDYSDKAAVPGVNRNHLHKAKVKVVTDPSEQNKLANKLWVLDQKIKINQQTNKTLEQIAQTLFKSWFVDFDPVHAKANAIAAGRNPERAAMATIAGFPPEVVEDSTQTEAELNRLPAERQHELAATAALFPGEFEESELGEIPLGWSSGTLNDICSLNMRSWGRKNIPLNVKYVDLANTKNGVIQEAKIFSWENAPSRAKRILKPGDTIIGTVRPGNRSFALVGETTEQLTASTGFAVLSPDKKYHREYLYLASVCDENIDRLAHLADGGAYPAVRPDIVTQQSCILPSIDICKCFSKITSSLLDMAHENRSQIEMLSKLRDTLLPKLLSGELQPKLAETQPEQEQLTA